MYCPSCGKEIPNKSAFCLHCGKQTGIANAPSALTPVVTEWEYFCFSWDWAPGKGGRYPLSLSRNEQLIRMNNWGDDQNILLPEIQKTIDNGWQAITEIGPSAYIFRRHSGNPDWLEVAAFRVKLRRPRPTTLPPQKEKLLGMWKIADIQSRGINKLARGLAGMINVLPTEMSFAIDNSYYQGKNSGLYNLWEDNIRLIPDGNDANTIAIKYAIKWNGKNSFELHALENNVVYADIYLQRA